VDELTIGGIKRGVFHVSKASRCRVPAQMAMTVDSYDSASAA
jgi:hypothetical protein